MLHQKIKSVLIVKQVAFLIVLPLLFNTVARAQTWDGDQSQIGQKRAGGFDYNWAKFPDGAFGTRKVTFDYSGTREILHAPAPGIHPRLYFNQEEIPDIQNRLNNTKNGKEIARKIRAFNILLHKGSAGFNRNAEYNKAQGGMNYVLNIGASDCNEGYQKLFVGDTVGYSTYLSDKANKWSSALPMEAFECLIKKGQPTDPEIGLSYEERAKNLAAVMTNIAKTGLERGVNPLKGISGIKNLIGVGFAMAYDYNYWAMTEEQRGICRKAVATLVLDKPLNFWDDHEPYSTAGNWVTLDAYTAIINFAIEGEEGYKPQFTQAYMRLLYNFTTYGWYNSGCPWEGIGKNYLMVGQEIAFAKRGYSLLGHPHTRAFGSNYLPQITQPFGYAFMSEDTWGGFGPEMATGKYRFQPIDAVGFKFAYPNDPAIDFMWRNFTGNVVNGTEFLDYSNNFQPGTHQYYDYMTILASYIDDWKEGDWTAQNKVALNNKLDFFETDRGQAILRSDFSPNALTAVFYTRQNFGGHTYADRNDLAFSALGRIWFTKRWGGSGLDDSEAQSVILVDGEAMCVTKKEGNKCRVPAKLDRWSSTENLGQATGDATYAYSWAYDWDNRPPGQDNPNLGIDGWIKETKTLNDFRAIASDEYFYKIPFYDFAIWGNGAKGNTEKMVKRPYNTMEKVFRTVSMSRGKHPFVLIVDDIKKDDKPHKYQWVAQLPSIFDSKTGINKSDLEVQSIIASPNENEQAFDIILKEKVGNRKLLVRVLNMSGYKADIDPKTIASVENHKFIASNNVETTIYRLVIEATTISPDFRIMLYPFEGTAELPTTIWNKEHTNLTVTFSDEIKSFSLVKEGQTNNYLLSENETLGVDSTAFNENSIMVYKNKGSIYVKSVAVAISNIKVFDIQGRLLAEQKEVNATTGVINNLKAINQVLIVKISDENNNVVTKKVSN